MDAQKVTTPSSDDVVLYKIDDGIATLTLNRPERMNGWNGAMQQRYLSVLQEAGRDDDVRVIVVTGAGQAFCPGADMDVLQADAADDGHDMAMRDRALAHMAATKVPKPVIAAINGACAGIGFVHALMCDLRFAARGAKFSTAFARRGLVAEHGSAWLLPRMIGMHRAFDLLASGRKFDADEAYELGLLNGVSEPESLLDDVYRYARDLADNTSPTSVAAIKYQLYRHQEIDLESSLHETYTMLLLAHRRPDTAEGSASWVENRKPSFPPMAEFRSI